ALTVQRVFFFRAEDGIRDFHVTGVQTCALPISRAASPEPGDAARGFEAAVRADGLGALEWSDAAIALRARLGLLRRAIGEPWPRSEERRGGKGGRSRGPEHLSEVIGEARWSGSR